MNASTSTHIHFISAGAGSGKTYSLTQKLEALLSSGEVTPAGVIATTFTKLAAGELKDRVRGALIEAGQLGVVVEGFFKVRHVPARVHRVAMEGAR